MRKPEEFIFGIIGVLWVILTFYLAYSAAAPMPITLLITTLTIIWCFITFKFWQKAWLGYVWPIFLGLLVACWWPMLDWLPAKDFVMATGQDALLLVKPWYATWTFKIIMAILPVLIGYGISWKISHSRKQVNIQNPTP